MTGWLGDEVAEWQGRHIARRVCETEPRARAVLVGEVRSIRAHPAHHVRRPGGGGDRGPAFDAWLDDDTGTVLLRWTRATVPGVAPGVRICVEGTVGILSGERGILNPLYRFDQERSSTS